MIVLLTGFVIIGIVLFFKFSTSSEYRKFNAEMKKRSSQILQETDFCTNDEIKSLPLCLQNFCSYINLAGSKKYNISHCYFRNTDFVFNERKNITIKMDYDLWNFSDRPYRTAFCKSSVMGIPFEGIDYFDELTGTGGMKGFLAKCIPLFDEKVLQMERTMYITLLAENAVLNPCFLLSDFVRYEEIDETKCRAEISCNGITGHGIFTFDGSVLTFESDERQADEMRNGEVVHIGWRCESGNFIGTVGHDGVKIPSYTRVIKVYPDKEVVYFDAKEFELELK